MKEKSCRKCVHQLMCEPFRKIEAVVLEEDALNDTWENMDGLYESIANMCDEYLEVKS
jgi:hypothetical protein